MTSPPPQIEGLRFVRRLGHGGYADVHLYEQAMPLMPVAVKVLRPAATDLGEQLISEANTMAELAEHPYIASILRAGVTADGRPYLVMSYYPRANLAERARGTGLPVAVALRTGIQIAAAVETAHRAGILHRDIKPANVLLSSYGAPALADFGIAGRSGAVDDEGEVGVSVAWTAPEVLRGVSNGSVAADVYSLAATVSFLLTGRSPFEVVGGDNSHDALVSRTMQQTSSRTGRADVPESLELLLQQGMAKEPDARPESALAFARALQSVEQELRLPRTEVVLLGDGRTDAFDATGDVTRIRSAAAVLTPSSDPAPVLGSESASSVGRPRRGRGRLAAMAALGAAGIAAAVAIGTTMLDSTDDEAPQPPATTTPTSQARPTTSASPSGSASPGKGARALDACLVGRWRTVNYRESVPGLGEITSLEREITVAEDGRMVITYDKAVAGGGTGLVFDGSIEYLVRTRGETLSFELVRNDGTLTVAGIQTPLTPGVSDVRYACQGDTFTEEANGFATSLTRVAPS